jgi:hypothetical protein
MNTRFALAVLLLMSGNALAFSQSGLPSGYAASLKPDNPYMATGGASAQHNDSYSSDVTPLAGPGSGAGNVKVVNLGALCPTILIGNSGYLFAYCVDVRNDHASLRILDPDTLDTMASLDMPYGGRLGGFYMYLDRQNRIVLGAGDNYLLRIMPARGAGGKWKLQIVNSWNLSHQVTGHCGANACDYLESVTPDWRGKIWFSTEGGVVGTVNPDTGAERSTTLPAGELVANSISSSPAGVAVASDHALYLMGSRKDGTPFVQWRASYDRGSVQKLGQLSHGTGATPVFFGREGHPYLAITDNADKQEHLLVYRVAAGAAANRLVCSVPLFASGASANENAPIGAGDSMIVSNTSGYNYDDHTGRNLQPLPGGITRIDVRGDGSGCDVKWTNAVPSAAVPKLSIADGLIYTVSRTLANLKPQYAFTAIDFRTGTTAKQVLIGDSYVLDTFQLAGAVGKGNALYQPTLTSIIRIQHNEDNPHH